MRTIKLYFLCLEWCQRPCVADLKDMTVFICKCADALQALSRNLLSPPATAGGMPGSAPAIVPDSAADAIAAEIAQASPMDLDGPADQASTHLLLITLPLLHVQACYSESTRIYFFLLLHCFRRL